MELYTKEEIAGQKASKKHWKLAAWTLSAAAAFLCAALLIAVRPLSESAFRAIAIVSAALTGCFDIYVASFILPYMRPKPKDTGRLGKVLRVLSNIFHQTHMYVIWILLSALLVSFLFNLRTDAPAAKKVEIYIDAENIQEAELETLLDRDLPQGIRMVKVHGFDYAAFGSHPQGSGDIYIVPESRIAEFSEGFTDAEGSLVYSASTGRGPGASYIRYRDEDYYLFYGNAGLHLEDGAAEYIGRCFMGLDDGFIYGMDASIVPANEASGVVYRGFDGEVRDVFKTLSEAGINCIRVRVWNDPFDEDGNGYGGGNCNIDTALEIGKRANKYGMKLLVDFHYSDFWADPGKQMVPKAWQGMSFEEKSEAVYSYTKDSLKKLRKEGIDVGMVQIGNETNAFFCGEKDWEKICALMNQGSRAVREVYPKALVALHFADPQHDQTMKSYAFMADQYKVDYDVFASSYYPFWHGSLDNLSSVLSHIAEKYGKKVMVMETSYAYTPDDSDFSGNTISGSSKVAKPYPYTVQGQADSVADVIKTLQGTPGGLGVCYWEGCWTAVPGGSKEENAKLWEEYGSGWASSYAAAYDPADAGRYYGGSAVDNQALFDPEGYPLDSLKTFKKVKEDQNK